jgi:hypothetical protein
VNERDSLLPNKNEQSQPETHTHTHTHTVNLCRFFFDIFTRNTSFVLLREKSRQTVEAMC